MGIGKWWLTHGPGSPGAVAKSVVKRYANCRAQFPDRSENQLLLLTLLYRMEARRRFGLQALGLEEATAIVLDLEEGLFSLIMFILHYEDERVEQCRIETPDIYAMIVDIVIETIRKYL